MHSRPLATLVTSLPEIMPLFSAARTDLCCHAFLLLLLLAIPGANAHGTATFWCKNTEGKLRVFIQHWHGTEGQSNPPSLGTIEVRDEADASLFYPTASGVVVDLGNEDGNGLPGCDGGGDPTLVGGCKGYDDYAYWDFVPRCYVPITYTVLGSSSAVFDEGCSGSGNMWPITISTLIQDTTPPVISVDGSACTSSPLTIDIFTTDCIDSTVTLASNPVSITAQDICDSSPTIVDTFTPGTYGLGNTVSFDVTSTDVDGNASTCTVNLNVKENTCVPSSMPSSAPSSNPTVSSPPSELPSSFPSLIPSSQPSSSPSSTPSSEPSNSPSSAPSLEPSSSPSSMPSSEPSTSPSSEPSSSPSSQPSSQPSPSPSSMPSSDPSSQPTKQPSNMPSYAPSSTPSSMPSMSPSDAPSSKPSVGPTISHSPSTMPSLEPSTHPSSLPSTTPSSAPSYHPSALPSSAPTPECQDYSVFDQTMFSFRDFGPNSAKIIVRGALTAITFEEATCDALKAREEELQIDIVSCCTSAVLTEEIGGGGRRLQFNNTNTTNTTYTAEFNTDIVYTGTTCNNTCQVAFADAIESDVFGVIIQGSVVDLQQIRSKSSKSGSSGRSATKRSSGGTMKSAASGGSMKSGASNSVASGGTMKSGTSRGTKKSGASAGTKKSGASDGSKKNGASGGSKKSGASGGSNRRFSGGGMKSGASRVGVDQAGPGKGMGPGVGPPRVSDTPGVASSKSKSSKKKKKSF